MGFNKWPYDSEAVLKHRNRKGRNCNSQNARWGKLRERNGERWDVYFGQGWITPLLPSPSKAVGSCSFAKPGAFKIVREKSEGLKGFVVRAEGGRARASEAGAGPRHCGESRGIGQASRGRADILESGERPGGRSRGPRTSGEFGIQPHGVREDACPAAQLCPSLRCATRKAVHTQEWPQPSALRGS